MLTTISGILFISGITGSIVMQKYRMRATQTSNANATKESQNKQSIQYQRPLSTIQETSRNQDVIDSQEVFPDKSHTH